MDAAWSRAAAFAIRLDDVRVIAEPHVHIVEEGSNPRAERRATRHCEFVRAEFVRADNFLLRFSRKLLVLRTPVFYLTQPHICTVVAELAH